jgi:hypothetical protein
MELMSTKLAENMKVSFCRRVSVAGWLVVESSCPPAGKKKILEKMGLQRFDTVPGYGTGYITTICT